jgi:hypothetical protein
MRSLALPPLDRWRPCLCQLRFLVRSQRDMLLIHRI